MRAKLCIQCTDDISGEVGSFLAEPQHMTRRAVSPIFDNVSDLFLWAKAEGWQALPFTTEFPVGLFEDGDRV